MLADRQADVDALAAEFASAGRGMSLAVVSGSNVDASSLLWTPSSTIGMLVAAVGFAPAPAWAELDEPADEDNVELSSERLGLLAGDVMICLSSNPDQEAFCASVAKEPLLADAPALRDGRVFVPPDGFAFYNLGSPDAHKAAVEFLRREVLPSLR